MRRCLVHDLDRVDGGGLLGEADELGQVIAGLTSEVIPAVAQGRIRPVIDSTFGITQAKQTADHMRSNRAHGKIVPTMP